MNYSVLLLLSFIVIGVKGQNSQDSSSFQIGSDQNRLGYTDWIINSLNNTSSDTFWKNGLLQMYKMFKPIANYDKRREPNFIAFNAQDSTMTVNLRKVPLNVLLMKFYIILA